MRDEIYFERTKISKSQIGGQNNKMTIIEGNESGEWKKIEEIWEDALEKVNSSDEKVLIKKALKLTKAKDKKGLGKLIKDYFYEFSKCILTGAAAEIVLKFLL